MKFTLTVFRGLKVGSNLGVVFIIRVSTVFSSINLFAVVFLLIIEKKFLKTVLKNNELRKVLF